MDNIKNMVYAPTRISLTNTTKLNHKKDMEQTIIIKLSWVLQSFDATENAVRFKLFLKILTIKIILNSVSNIDKTKQDNFSIFF